MRYLDLSPEDREMIVSHAKLAAVAIANYMEALDMVGQKNGVVFQDTVKPLELIASGLPQFASLEHLEDLKLEDIIGLLSVLPFNWDDIET